MTTRGIVPIYNNSRMEIIIIIVIIWTILGLGEQYQSYWIITIKRARRDLLNNSVRCWWNFGKYNYHKSNWTATNILLSGFTYIKYIAIIMNSHPEEEGRCKHENSDFKLRQEIWIILALLRYPPTITAPSIQVFILPIIYQLFASILIN